MDRRRRHGSTFPDDGDPTPPRARGGGARLAGHRRRGLPAGAVVPPLPGPGRRHAPARARTPRRRTPRDVSRGAPPAALRSGPRPRGRGGPAPARRRPPAGAPTHALQADLQVAVPQRPEARGHPVDPCPRPAGGPRDESSQPARTQRDVSGGGAGGDRSAQRRDRPHARLPRRGALDPAAAEAVHPRRDADLRTPLAGEARGGGGAGREPANPRCAAAEEPRGGDRLQRERGGPRALAATGALGGRTPCRRGAGPLRLPRPSRPLEGAGGAHRGGRAARCRRAGRRASPVRPRLR